MLTPELTKACDLRPTPNVSSHQYDSTAIEIIEWARAIDGKVLDCGAGLRQSHNPTVVNLEIVDYPTTDVIAVGQALPFEDSAFDAVFSLAVLEHVSDPFACANEIVRVLKPGGRLYCGVPFLQPEHGFPNHFYNMSRQGLLNLFRNKLIVDRHYVPPSGLPIWCLHWFLSQYLAHLDQGVRNRFKDMRVSDFLARTPAEFLSDEIVTALEEEGNWILACTTAALMHKPAVSV